MLGAVSSVTPTSVLQDEVTKVEYVDDQLTEAILSQKKLDSEVGANNQVTSFFSFQSVIP